MTSPINTLIDRHALQCTRCLRSKGDPSCRCWIEYVCQSCGARKTDNRTELEEVCGFEIPEETIVVTQCPRCR